ncbi:MULTISPECIES: LacI family DNA-binding transcriptional regulator [unclassified Stenotrophomonas]|jgi:LacI family transcriptional regulator|uniref:LacI family DNA-binding transcriptional regulator n=1 Tax=unclassified Stenotrophomonas TaxID=196198 RepID=UPI0005AEFE55|nr:MULTISPECIES: LacI family DNA-binding transcriptional regulator [unclassified Stenotrophomonas]KIP85953.1 transcriptional regulator [Stenotrophomonas maltophilia]MBD8642927.1 LacI family DNA-binding transcriptional regulator [Stenotrophomonas sp. CFBP 13724]MDY1034592.1 LacI family DNA-binding transcriptional regulator [Stenotrophomonas sp. CFBP8980]
MNDATGSKGPRKSGDRAVTVTDIARAIGVSRATVSLVLRGSPLVNVDTRAKVEAELRRQRYVYNRAAANLRRRTSSSVALVINDLSNPFFAEFAAGVDEALGDQGYVTLLGSTGESPQRQQAVLGTLMEHTPAGLILSPAEGSDTAQVRQALGPTANVLLFNRALVGADWDFLALDNQQGAYLATRHLIERGHREIAFFGGHADSSSCEQRRAGYQQALGEAGLSVTPQWLIESAPNRLEAARRVDELFVGGGRPSAAVCYNDTVALGLMLGLTSRGIRPGGDFAVTGFDDIPEAAVAVPPLTTLTVDPRARGRQAAELLLQRVQAPDAPPQRTVAPVQLRIRESSAARPN